MKHICAAIAAALLVTPAAQGVSPRATLLEARNLAYDANYRNDKTGLRSAIATLQTLTQAPQEAAYAHYYISFSYWMLSASYLEDENMDAAREAAAFAVEHARTALAARPNDSEFHTMLGEALTFLTILDQNRRKQIRPELEAARLKALELDPKNPRAVMMDAGLIFWAPPDHGGSQQRGLERWHEAQRYFEAEANAATVDPVAPRWGLALSYGWMASNLLAMNPPQKENARAAVETALQMRPDFWFARERVLPRTLEGTAGGAPRAAMGESRSARSEPGVTGIGGVFFRAKDPESLRGWYSRNLGIQADEQGKNFFWLDSDSGRYGRTVWSVFPRNTSYFGRGKQEVMINYRVSGLDELLVKLRAAGVRQIGEVQEYWYGRFAWIVDAEGNRVELWEPDQFSPDEFARRMKLEAE